MNASGFQKVVYGPLNSPLFRYYRSLLLFFIWIIMNPTFANCTFTFSMLKEQGGVNPIPGGFVQICTPYLDLTKEKFGASQAPKFFYF